MYLVVEPESAGYVVLGPTLGLLEAVPPKIARHVFQSFHPRSKSLVRGL